MDISIPRLTLDAEDITDKGIIRGGKHDHVQARIGGMLSLHFLRGWEKEKREAVLAMAEEYITIFPEQVDRYQLSGEKRYRKLTSLALPPKYYHMTDTGEDAKGYVFLVKTTTSMNPTPPLWMFWSTMFSKTQAKVFSNGKSDYPLSGIKVHFPPRFLLEEPDGFTDLVTRWSEAVGALHGSAGLAVITEPGTEKKNLYNYPLAKAFPALDYDNRGMFWVEISEGNWEDVRTSNWITILGDEPVFRIGGLGAIQSVLNAEMNLTPYEGGIVIRAGKMPALGNDATGGIPESYQIASRLIKPIRFEGYNWGGLFGLPEEEKDDKIKINHEWIRRHD